MAVMDVVRHLFERVHGIVTSAGGYAMTDARAVKGMWEESPVSAAILAAGGVLTVVLGILVLRLIIKLVRRTFRGLAWVAAIPGGPIGRIRGLRRIRRQLHRVPGTAVAEYATVARNRDVPTLTWLADHAPRGTLFEDHLRAIRALLVLEARLPERSLLQGEAVILGQLHSHLPVLVEYLISQMIDLAEIQQAAGADSLDNDQMHYPALIDEARRVYLQLAEITRIMPILIDHALVGPHLERMSRKTLDLESLRVTIKQLLEIGRL
jgi:hypothetical protein